MAKETKKEIVNCRIKFVRISPYKLRRIADIVRGKKVLDAIALLKNLPHKGAKILLKAVNSVQSNATNNHGYTESETLIISDLKIDEAPKFKRYQPRARGRMYQIIKRNSHISVEVKGAK